MTAALQVVDVRHAYGKTVALDGVSVAIPAASSVAIIGPDGVGKSTLLGLIATAKRLQQGGVTVLGTDVRSRRGRAVLQTRVAYMPQGLGRNLYADLSVRENLEFFGRLFGLDAGRRAARIDELLAATGLAPFPERPAGKLSGGMKQKLSLCCALLHDPDLLILDEPTTGVDPLSRRQFWDLIERIRAGRPGMSVLVATSYMDEAERFERVLMMHAGRLLADGTPAELKARTGAEDLEEAFVALLPEAARRGHARLVVPPRVARADEETAIEARGLTRRFGDFTAVDRVSFRIPRGEIFGFLGSNGCGKTTTMKMLTGLLPASEGEAHLFGAPVAPNDLETRRRVGYMAQAFSLYGELTVRQNLRLHARLFGLGEGLGTSFSSPSSSPSSSSSFFRHPREGGDPGFTPRPLVGSMDPRLRGDDGQRSGRNGQRGGDDGQRSGNDEPTGGGEGLESRLAQLTRRFDLGPYLDTVADGVPLGVRQRLSLAVAVLHDPELLILDEPTSGVDPVARDLFWADLVALSREQGVTIFVSTHFMNEAARCDRVAFMHAGRVIAVGAPDELRRSQNAASLDDAFVGFMRQAAEDDGPQDAAAAPPPATPHAPETPRAFSPRRLLAYAWREALELRRDAVRLTVALLGMVLLMLVFGYGITMDVEDLAFAVLDRDQSPESRDYIERFDSSPYFLQRPPLSSPAELERRLQQNDMAFSIEIPPDFGRDLRRGGRAPEVAVRIDGAMPFRAETIQGYVAGLHQRFIQDKAEEAGADLPPPSASVETRYRYNQAFRSLDAMVPGTMALLLVFIPAILAALGVVREKELGSITNLYVTPVTRLEFLLGKQIPYVVIAYGNFLLLVAMALWLFGVPLKGSLGGLLLGGFVYVCATTALGLFISAFTSTQTAAVFGTAIATTTPATQFSGMLQPTSTLEGPAYVFGQLFPTTHFLKVCLGAFTKGLAFADLVPFIAITAAFVPVLLALGVLFLRKQER